jgi:hypothetical protein
MTKEAGKETGLAIKDNYRVAVIGFSGTPIYAFGVSLVVPVCTLIRSTGFQSSTYDIVHNCVFSATISVFFSDSISFPPVNNVVL